MYVHVGPDRNENGIGLRYIHIRFFNQWPNRFGLDLDIWIRNPNPYPNIQGIIKMYVRVGLDRIENGIGLRYIYIRFFNQRPNRFGLDLDIQMKNPNPYPTKWIRFRLDLGTNLIH